MTRAARAWYRLPVLAQSTLHLRPPEGYGQAARVLRGKVDPSLSPDAKPAPVIDEVTVRELADVTRGLPLSDATADQVQALADSGRPAFTIGQSIRAVLEGEAAPKGLALEATRRAVRWARQKRNAAPKTERPVTGTAAALDLRKAGMRMLTYDDLGEPAIGPPPTKNRATHPFVGTVRLHGLPLIRLENLKGSTRSGTDSDGNAWAVTMPAHYGEFARSEGADGDPVDVFVGPLRHAPKAYVIHLQDPTTGAHDEDKVFVAFATADDARACFAAAYNRSDLKMGPVRTLSTIELAEWLTDRENRGQKIEAGRLLAKSAAATPPTCGCGTKMNACRCKRTATHDGWSCPGCGAHGGDEAAKRTPADLRGDVEKSAAPTSQTYGTPANVQKPKAAEPPPAPPPVARPHHHADVMQLPTKPTKRFPPPSHPKPTKAPRKLMETPPELTKSQVQRSAADDLMESAGLTHEAEIPEWLAMGIDSAGGLVKGAGHKYIRRAPKSGGGYRYFYRVSGGKGGVGHESEFEIGAAFRVKDAGQEGHFHVTGKAADGTLTIKHDETGATHTISASALRSMLHTEHAEAIGAHRAKLAGDLKDAKEHGATAKQVARLEAEAAKHGVAGATVDTAGHDIRQRAEALPDGMLRRDALDALARGDHAAARESVEAAEALPKPPPAARDEIERSANVWRSVLTGRPIRRMAERSVVFGSIADPHDSSVPTALRSAITGINTALTGRVPPDLHNAIMGADPRRVVDLAEHIAREHIGTDVNPAAGPVAPGSPQGVVDWLNTNQGAAFRLLGGTKDHVPPPKPISLQSGKAWKSRDGGAHPGEVVNGPGSEPHVVLARRASYIRDEGLSFGIDDDSGWAVSYTARPMTPAERVKWDEYKAAVEAAKLDGRQRENAIDDLTRGGREVHGEEERTLRAGATKVFEEKTPWHPRSVWLSQDGQTVIKLMPSMDDFRVAAAPVTDDVRAAIGKITADPPKPPARPTFELSKEDTEAAAASGRAVAATPAQAVSQSQSAVDAQRAAAARAAAEQKSAADKAFEEKIARDRAAREAARVGQPPAPSALTPEKKGARVYVRGDSYRHKDKLRARGFHWDGEERAWWIGAAKWPEHEEKVKMWKSMGDQRHDADALLKAAGAEKSGPPKGGSYIPKDGQSWREFTAEHMSAAMKEAGGHGPAMSLMGAAWKAHKAGSASTPSPAAGADKADKAAKVSKVHERMQKLHTASADEAANRGDGALSKLHADAAEAHGAAMHAHGAGLDGAKALSDKAKAATQATLDKHGALAQEGSAAGQPRAARPQATPAAPPNDGEGAKNQTTNGQANAQRRIASGEATEKPNAGAVAAGVGGRSKEGLKVIAIGPKGGKIVGYTTSKDGKRKAIYEGSAGAQKLAGTVATHAPEPEKPGAGTPAAKPAEAAPSVAAEAGVPAAPAEKGPAGKGGDYHRAKQADHTKAAEAAAAAGDTAGAAKHEDAARAHWGASLQNDRGVKGDDAEGASEAADEKSAKANAPAGGRQTGAGDAGQDAQEDGAPAAPDAPAAPSEPIDDKPLTPDEPAGGAPSDAPAPEALGSASPKTDSPEARHAEEITKLRGQVEDAHKKLAALAHHIDANLVPMFNNLKGQARAAHRNPSPSVVGWLIAQIGRFAAFVLGLHEDKGKVTSATDAMNGKTGKGATGTDGREFDMNADGSFTETDESKAKTSAKAKKPEPPTKPKPPQARIIEKSLTPAAPLRKSEAADTEGACVRVLVTLQAVERLHHAAHLQAKGPESYSDHLMFGRLYDGVQAELDGLSEKMVSAFGEACVDADARGADAAETLNAWMSLGGDPPAIGLSAELELQRAIANALEQEPSIGLENLLQGIADRHETWIYLLQQRMSPAVEKSLRATTSRQAHAADALLKSAHALG